MIRVTFEDGTVETWPPNAPAFISKPTRSPQAATLREWWDDESPMSYVEDERGWAETFLWRIIGQDAETKALVGEWQAARVETVAEQIARIEAETSRLAVELRDALATAVRMRESFDGFDNAIDSAQRAYHNWHEWRDEQHDPINNARSDFYKAFESLPKVPK